MSIEDLKSDMSTNLAELKAELHELTTTQDLVKHLTLRLWPFLENVVSEVVEIDASVEEIYGQQDDVLSFETGQQLAGVIAGAQLLLGEYRKVLAGRIQDPATQAKVAAISQWEQLAKAAMQTLEEVTLPSDADDAGDDTEESDLSDDGDAETEEEDADE